MGSRCHQPPGAAVHPWWILFGEGQGGAWWHRFLTPGYRHVMAVAPVTDGTVMIEHTGRVLLLEHVRDRAEDVVLHLMQTLPVRHVLHVHGPGSVTVEGAHLRPPMTCVEVTKAILGLHAPFVVTPWQLAQRLRAMGARDVTVSIPEPIHA